MASLPRTYESFSQRYRKVWEAYDRLANACHQAGPVNEKNRALVKLAISIGARMEGAVHSHTRRSLAAGATPREIRHVVLLGVTTIGFPSSMAAFSWVEDVLKKRSTGRKKRRSR